MCARPLGEDCDLLPRLREFHGAPLTLRLMPNGRAALAPFAVYGGEIERKHALHGFPSRDLHSHIIIALRTPSKLDASSKLLSLPLLLFC